MTDKQRMIDATKRAARRIARDRSLPHQTALDEITVGAGRRNWSDFLSDPVEIDRRTPARNDASRHPAVMIGDPHNDAVHDLTSTGNVPGEPERRHEGERHRGGDDRPHEGHAAAS